jgi:hypothetical protein
VVNTVVFLWISAGATALRPSAEALATLNDFGRARDVTFVEIASASTLASTDTNADRPLGLPTNDAAIVDALEADLEQARTALSALEEAAAGARLTRVERQLLAHPHLPQAAFLMGECLALQSQAAREPAPALATALEARRLALEGPRAVAFGAPPALAVALAAHEVALGGLNPEDELELDGVWRGSARRVNLLPGLHHARVTRRGRAIFATFVELSPEQTALELDVPPLVACSREDLDTAGAAPRAVACPRWAKVREDSPGIGVALCEHERCGAFVHWRRHMLPPFAPIVVDQRGGLPAWASFTIAGAAALAATGLVLWQAGAFEHGRPSAASWEYGGLNPRPQGMRF